MKLPPQEPYDLVVMPLRVEPVYEEAPGQISIVTVPPEASVVTPACTAAVQTELSSV